CVQFHTQFDEIQPVYLAWHAPGAPGPQYALIYRIDIAQNTEPWETNYNELSIQVEREPYWRGIPPGANPKLWTTYWKDFTFDTSSAYLTQNGADFNIAYDAAVDNRHEWNTGTDPRTHRTENFIDIDAADIPGDAPALTTITMNINGTSGGYIPRRIFIGRQTKGRSVQRRDSDQDLLKFNTLLAADGSVENSAAYAAGGANRRYADGSAYTAQVLNANISSTPEEYVTWEPSQQFDFQRFRGRYQVFMRGAIIKQGGDDPVTGDMQVKLQAKFAVGNEIILSETDWTDVAYSPYASITSWMPLHYLGEMTFPINARTAIGLLTYGEATYTNAGGALQLLGKQTAGDDTLMISDLVFFPVDEPNVEVIFTPLEFSEFNIFDPPDFTTATILDNT
ncbi:MAG: hypothetical protein K8I30_23950, partial [Anaerolineae bacterium]|nr:hypothetical protein [Anaerolineae bacterium]